MIRGCRCLNGVVERWSSCELTRVLGRQRQQEVVRTHTQPCLLIHNVGQVHMHHRQREATYHSTCKTLASVNRLSTQTLVCFNRLLSLGLSQNSTKPSTDYPNLNSLPPSPSSALETKKAAPRRFELRPLKYTSDVNFICQVNLKYTPRVQAVTPRGHWMLECTLP
jgi:hypothetical protein